MTHSIECVYYYQIHWEKLKRECGFKSNKTIRLLGCSMIELSRHLESQFKSGMNWENYTFRGWHIDHIQPICSFNLTKEEEQKKCFHYTNLQPLWWYENLSKGGRINE